MQILHLCLDEKFIAFARKVYETAWPGQNRFLIYRPNSRTPVFNPVDDITYHLDLTTIRGWRCRDQIDRADCVVVHFLDPAFVPLVGDLPAGKLAVWHGWGADIYPQLGHLAPDVYLPETRALMQKLERDRLRKIVSHPMDLLQRLQTKLMLRRNIRACLYRFDRISMGPAEFDLLKTRYPDLPATFQHFHYNSVEDVFDHGPERMNGPDILLGNSASPSNNHLDAFQVLKSLMPDHARIVCPLSYGDNEYGKSDYARRIAETGEQLFGDRFIPLREFLPAVEYNQLLASCGTVIMNQRRQQAVGTVATALYKGASVYLREENTVLDFFRDMGNNLFSLDSAEQFEHSLSEEETRQNRSSLARWYSFEKVVASVRDYETILKQEKGSIRD